MSLQDLIPVVNRLQDIVTTTQVAELDLPVLAVVGSQSCGKSSVLENIVGRDFLPRGTGIVTRRPLVLQLINIKDSEVAKAYDYSSESSDSNSVKESTPDYYESHTHDVNLEEYLKKNKKGNSGAVEWGEFLHIPKKRFFDFNEIRKEIERETARIAGTNKGISRLPINLKIYSTKVLNLTMVDLPGLTKIPIGDQPTDIERQTRGLILEYISRPNSIILAVSPANVDLVNSESLKLARQVDPTGKRTVGILTKLDLMDEGTNAVEILKGNVYPLKLGFIGIVNRSQRDITESKTLEESLSLEQKFFQNHPAYSVLANKCGTRYLANTLNKILMNHIRDRLPDMKAKLNTLVGQCEQELASYGESPIHLVSSKEGRGALVLNLMNKFATSFINSIDGTQVSASKDLCGGARIYYIYNEVFGSQLASINPVHNLSISDIRIAIRNSSGPRASLFVPEMAFDLLVKPQIHLLEDPSRKCVEHVYEELMKIVHNVCSNGVGIELNRYPKLQSKLIEVVSDLLRERLGPTIKYVESLIEIHQAYINTNHPNFIGAGNAMKTVVEERQKQKEAELRSRLRLASERLLSSKKLKAEETDDNDADDDDKENVEDHEDIEDINQIDEDLVPRKRQTHRRADSFRTFMSETSNVTNGHAMYQESYLNYFFGKDPTTHQQYLQTQAQLHPTPFKFPHQTDVLQFNNQNGDAAPNSGSMNLDLKGMSLEEESFESDETINELTEKEQLECELIRRLIVSYFGIVREMVQDQVPKLVMCLLVNYVKQHIQNRLVVKLYNDDLFDDLLYEDENIQMEREKCLHLLKTYKKASAVIGEVV